MFRLTKAEMTLTTIVAAVVAVLVLVVLIFIFTRGAGTSADALSSCETAGGKLSTESVKTTCPSGTLSIGSYKDASGAKVACCKGLPTANP